MTPQYSQLLSPQYAPLLQAAADCRDFTIPAALDRLRALTPADSPDPTALLRAAIDLTIARRKAAIKFPPPHYQPDQLLLDPLGLEQSSSADVANHKAARFAKLNASHIIDLCCGIGGDAMSLATLPNLQTLTLYDTNPNRLEMAKHNIQLTTQKSPETICDDVTTLNLPNVPFHIDPDRRPAGKRTHAFEDIVPPPAFIHQLIDSNTHGCIKLSPAVDTDSLPPEAELEFINRHGTLVQALLWTGDLIRDPHQLRTATRIETTGQIHQFAGSPNAPIPISTPKQFLFAIDSSIERAQLLGQLATHLNAPCIHPALGLLTSDQPIDSPFGVNYKLLEQLPWRPKKVKAALRALDAGIITVKTRGKATDPNAAAAQLRGKGPNPFTVFVLRAGKKINAYITQKL